VALFLRRRSILDRNLWACYTEIAIIVQGVKTETIVYSEENNRQAGYLVYVAEMVVERTRI